MKKITLIIICFLIILTGCASEQSNSQESNTAETEMEDQDSKSDQQKYGGHVTIRTSTQNNTFGFPVEHLTLSTGMNVSSPALETLGRYDAEGNMHPWLAEKWDIDPENALVTIALKEGIQFHDGSPFNAEAVKWNLELWKEKKRREVSLIESIEVIDEYTLKLNFIHWENAAFHDICWMIQMVSPTAYEEHGEEWMRTNPVGTGPFKFDSHQTDVYIKYVRNDQYWIEGLPYLDSIEWRIIPDPNTAKNAFLGEELDISLFMTPDIVVEVKNIGDEKFELGELKTPFGHVANGLISGSAKSDSPFADVRVRKAISYAIDRESIVNSIYRGMVIPTNQLGPPETWYFNEEVDPFKYSPEKAIGLLTEAGYPDGFKTTLIGMPQHSALMQAVQGYLGDVGIEVDISVVEDGRYHDYAYNGWDGLIVWAYTTEAEPTGGLKRILGEDASTWGPGIVQIPDIHQLINEAATAMDQKEKTQKVREIQKAVFEEHVLATSIFVNTTPFLKNKRVQDDGFFTMRGNLFTPETMWVKE